MALRSPSERCAVERPILMAGARDIFQNAAERHNLFHYGYSLLESEYLKRTQNTVYAFDACLWEGLACRAGSIQTSKLEALESRSMFEPAAGIQVLTVEDVCSLVGPRTKKVKGGDGLQVVDEAPS